MESSEVSRFVTPSRMSYTKEGSHGTKTSLERLCRQRAQSAPSSVLARGRLKEPRLPCRSVEPMTSGIDMCGQDMSDLFAHHLESLNAYREGRIAGSRHAQRSAVAGVVDSPPLVDGGAKWRSGGPEWFFHGFCESLAAYEISC